MDGYRSFRSPWCRCRPERLWGRLVWNRPGWPLPSCWWRWRCLHQHPPGCWCNRNGSCRGRAGASRCLLRVAGCRARWLRSSSRGSPGCLGRLGIAGHRCDAADGTGTSYSLAQRSCLSLGQAASDHHRCPIQGLHDSLRLGSKQSCQAVYNLGLLIPALEPAVDDQPVQDLGHEVTPNARYCTTIRPSVQPPPTTQSTVDC
jgi:hypothetical protein